MNQITTPAEVIRLKAGKAKPGIVAERLASLAPVLPPPNGSTPIIEIEGRLKAKRQAKPLQERIDRLTDKSGGPDGVWKWLGSRSQGNGYPQISYRDPETGKQTTKAVHRVLMELKLGRKLDRSECVLHDRGVPKDDVNPAHHRLGTQQENLDDAKAEGRLRGKLDVKSILKIVELREKHHVENSTIAHRFGVSVQTVQSILKGKTHSKITGRTYAPGKTGRPKKVALKVEVKSKRQRGADAATLGAVG